MNTRNFMIVDNKLNEVITSKVENYEYIDDKIIIKFTTGKSYPYGMKRISVLKDPIVLNPSLYRLNHNGKELFNISEIYVFQNNQSRYWHICFRDGSERDYNEENLKIYKSCLDDKTSINVFSYLKETASTVSLKAEDGTELLSVQYEKISKYIDESSVLASYLNPSKYMYNEKRAVVPVFPFGCNASQYEAVKAALENKISVIQGPPGTGKTQTILNIIANLLIAGKTVQVVSNNNSATANVLEKLASPKYGMDFLVASLGKTQNKRDFIKNQNGKYPDLSSWKQEALFQQNFFANIMARLQQLNRFFDKQTRLARAKQELKDIELELSHFEQYSTEAIENLTQHKIRKKLKSDNLMQLWHECQTFSDENKKVTFLFKFKSRMIYGISTWKFYKSEIAIIINTLQNLFYKAKVQELSDEINILEHELEHQNAKELSKEFTELSMSYLKAVLYRKYGNKPFRPFFSEDDLWKNHRMIQEEYPIVLSTTFSSRSSLCKDASFDYLIMDEASQVDVATGALALSCAENAVIVGDTKQLPNVVTENIKKRSDAIFESYKINESYRFANKSFLSSVCELFPEIPNTLLKEHYRCHPKIINFCNQKFYDGSLVIMTDDNNENDVLSVIKTVVGNHERDHMNQRQIDSIITEVLPKLIKDTSDIGIIAPYNNQVNALKSQISNAKTEIDTVHKFQGREKEAVILTTVDNETSEFSDDPYLLNVAISRAKKKLCLVVSGNEQSKDSNIYDLISYIEYNNFTVTQSKVYSVFDYLYRQYTQSRPNHLLKYKRISEYDSENLMYALIKDTLNDLGMNCLDVICHHPLNMLIREYDLLNDEERRYAMHNSTHLDFLIYNRISKKPVLAVEVDGYSFHKEGEEQAKRDKMKNHILELYEIPYLRFATNGSGEKERLYAKIKELVK